MPFWPRQHRRKKPDGNRYSTRSHTIVDRGHPKAAETDQLTCGNRKFYVQGVDEPGQLGLYTIYYVEERADV